MNPEEVEALVKRYYERRKLSWNTLSFWEKAKLFKMWYFVSMIGNLCTIFGSVMFLMSDVFEISNSELLIGAGAFCTWSSITKYLRNTQSLNVIMRTFHEAIPMIAKVWLGILPVYIGVCFLTITVCFEFPASYGTATSAFYTFFSLQAGDALYDTYTSMRKVNFIYALLFMYCFLFFLVSIMQNIFMCIVEDSYVSIKYEKNFRWLRSGGTEGNPNHDDDGGDNGGNDGNDNRASARH